MGTFIIIILLIIIIGLLSAKYIPFLIILALLYSIFGKATLGVLFLASLFWLRSWINKDKDYERNN